MKLYEALEMLYRDRTLKFKREDKEWLLHECDGWLRFDRFDSEGKLISDDNRKGRFNDNFNLRDTSEWVLVDCWEEVPMMRAIEEFLVNKGDIKRVFGDGSIGLLIYDVHRHIVIDKECDEIKWFIRGK